MNVRVFFFPQYGPQPPTYVLLQLSAVRVNKSVFKTTLQLYEDLSKGGGGEKI